MSRSKDSLLTFAQTSKTYLVPKHFYRQEMKIIKNQKSPNEFFCENAYLV